MYSVLILEKQETWRKFFKKTLAKNYKVHIYSDYNEVFKELTSKHYPIFILDQEKNKKDSFDFLRRIKTKIPDTSVIITSFNESAEMAVKSIKLGAADFIAKPFSGERIKFSIKQTLEERSLKNEIDYLRREQDIIYNFDEIIARSPVMKNIINTLKKFSRTDSTLLITGETGTGKSFLSGTLHFNSLRRNRPFIKINCSNIPETLLESELFGHEKGAFTGANKLRVGRFEQAHGGTIFLDEIGEMTLPLQAKMLRVLEDKSFERVGGNKTIHADVRIIAATNRNLEEETAKKIFREDLYYRINVLSVRLPPLRERKDCIEPLAELLLNKICRSMKKKITGFASPILDWFKSYDWPGNIRQLSNTIERAVILEDNQKIQKESISMLEPLMPYRTQKEKSPARSLKTIEKDIIIKALEESLWVQKDAAKRLEISPRALIYKIKKYRITHHRWRKNV